jgi:PRTRC genetic system ThiF family protein
MKHNLPSDFSAHQLGISVVGCGGNGSQILSGLARLNAALRAFGHPGLNVTAYDPDLVSDANVGRQLFSPSDLGQNKAFVLINRINNYYGLAWKAVPTRFTPRATSTFLRDHHFVIGCVDSIASRREIARCSNAIYWLDLGNSDKKGQVILGEFEFFWRSSNRARARREEKMAALEAARKAGRPDPAPATRLPHVLDIFPELKNKNKKFKEDDAPSCSLAEALERQDLFINQSVSTFALQLLWQFIRQGGLDIHGYFINLESGRVTPLPIK